jgi:uncharacterized protein (TIGR03437 family)
MSILGTDFAPAGTDIAVQRSDLVNGVLPTSLGTTCVKVGDVKAFLTYVSSTQLNFQAPDIPVSSNVVVQVIANCGTGNKLKGIRWILSIQPAAPEFLYWIHLPNGRSPIVAVDAITGAKIGRQI